MKNIILITLIFFLSGCGYTSIYNDKKIVDFQLNIEEMKGDNEFNNLIKRDLKLFSKHNSQKIYLLKINDNINIFKFQESINIKPNSNAFEQREYEKNIKRNFASSIREKLIIKILDTNDN